MIDKAHLVTQLKSKLQQLAAGAEQACGDAAREAKLGATAKEKRDDARVALEYSRMANAQKKRAKRATAELKALTHFAPKPFGRREAIAIGAVIEIEDEDSGEGRTLFLAPTGAGETLSGPAGDGLFSVITPASPVGRAVVGKRIGDVVEVTVRGECREYAVCWIA